MHEMQNHNATITYKCRSVYAAYVISASKKLKKKISKNREKRKKSKKMRNITLKNNASLL